MRGKLIKGKNSGEYMINLEGVGYVTTYESTLPHKLSLKNCQAIERGYDLDELFDKVDKSIDYHEFDLTSFRLGFQKALEILGDKKFSEEDMREAIQFGLDAMYGYKPGKDGHTEVQKNKYIQSLQPTEWDVEIVEEKVYDGLDEMAQPQYVKQPKLDADGCLILKII